MYEERLKRYFETESSKGDLSPQQWEDVLLHVKSHKERHRFWRLMPPLFTRRPALATATSLAMAVVVVGISLLVAAPWREAILTCLARPGDGDWSAYLASLVCRVLGIPALRAGPRP